MGKSLIGDQDLELPNAAVCENSDACGQNLGGTALVHQEHKGSDQCQPRLPLDASWISARGHVYCRPVPVAYKGSLATLKRGDQKGHISKTIINNNRSNFPATDQLNEDRRALHGHVIKAEDWVLSKISRLRFVTETVLHCA